MTVLPSPANVYGFLLSPTGLEQVAAVLQSRLGLTETEVYIGKSADNYHQILYIHTAVYEFEIRKVQQRTWSICGTIAGDRSEILRVLKYLSTPLHYAGDETAFEVYDAEFNCIAEYSGSERDP